MNIEGAASREEVVVCLWIDDGDEGTKADAPVRATAAKASAVMRTILLRG